VVQVVEHLPQVQTPFPQKKKKERKKDVDGHGIFSLFFIMKYASMEILVS
jgi:hypothetical protein